MLWVFVSVELFYGLFHIPENPKTRLNYEQQTQTIPYTFHKLCLLLPQPQTSKKTLKI